MMYILMKLVSGEEVVAKSEESDNSDKAITVTDPYMFMYGTDYEGAMGIKLVDFMYYSDEKVFTIDKNHVIYYTYRVNSKLIEYYKNTIETKNKSISDVLKAILSKIDPETIH